MRFRFIIPLLLTISVFGQSSNHLDVESKLWTTKKDLVAELQIKNKTNETYYINTTGIWIAMDSLDSLVRLNGLTAFLESESGQFIPYNVLTEFRQYDNVKKEVRKLNKINKYPKIKINPKDYLILKKQKINSLTITIPTKYWELTKGNKYNLTITYKQTADSEEFKNQKLSPLRQPKNKYNYLIIR